MNLITQFGGTRPHFPQIWERWPQSCLSPGVEFVNKNKSLPNAFAREPNCLQTKVFVNQGTRVLSYLFHILEVYFLAQYNEMGIRNRKFCMCSSKLRVRVISSVWLPLIFGIISIIITMATDPVHTCEHVILFVFTLNFIHSQKPPKKKRETRNTPAYSTGEQAEPEE